MASTAAESKEPPPMDWETLFDQVNKSIPSAQIACTVSEPESVGGLLGKHITYAVRTEPLGMVVRRRYNDFRWLRDALSARYVGLFIPSLPETKGIVNPSRSASVTSDHIKSRLKLLGMFLERAVRIPFLRTDTTLIAFLTMEDDSEWDSAKQTVGQLSIGEERSLGCMRWRAVLDALPVPDQAERKIMEITLQIDNLRQMFRKIEASVDDMAAQIGAYDKSLHSFMETFEEWKVMEQTLSDVFQAQYNSSYGENMCNLMAQYACTLGGWRHLLGVETEMVTDVLHAMIHYEMLQVEAFRAQIKHWQDTNEASDKLEKKLAQLKEEKASGQPKRMTLLRHDSRATDDSIAELEEEISSRKAHEGYIQKALVYYEIQRFNYMRNAALKDVISIMSVAQLHYCKTLANLWKGTIQAVPIDLDAAVDRARVVLPQIADSLPTHGPSGPACQPQPSAPAATALPRSDSSAQLEEARESDETPQPRLTELLEPEPFEEYDV